MCMCNLRSGSEVPLFTSVTNAKGCVGFGSGLPDGTYWVIYDWAGIQHREIITIDCSKINWSFEFTVDNPTIVKTFVYDLPNWNPAYPPKQGLEVTVTDQTGASFTLTTDENGQVSWSADVGYTYTLSWLYGGESHTETIGPVAVPESQEDLLIEVTNYLEPKSAEQKGVIVWGV
jgi:hypothetical protein